jgi:UDP-N-acetylglucosamine diphosphorylase/glucosamine-1-phosphate N-acetyltransferase
MNIILFDNQFRTNLIPFTYIRPISDIRVGIMTIKEKWEYFFNDDISDFTVDYLMDRYPLYLEEDNLFIAGNLIPNQSLVDTLQKMELGTAIVDQTGTLIALRAGSPDQFQSLDQFPKTIYSESYLAITEKHQIFQFNGDEIISDYKYITQDRQSALLSSSNTLIGDLENLFIEEGAIIESSTINCSKGPVYIGQNAEIMEGSNIRGPFALLNDAVIKMGSKIYGETTIGPHCKVGGEISNVVMFGYSNKAHDGYLGNAVIGTWCNIGAGTVASNLKNDYSEVKQWNYATENYKKTGLQFCGLMMGDHSKCGINVSFNTGTVMGICCNVYDSNFQPLHIPSFSFGSPTKGYEKNILNKIISAESAMMNRRNIDPDETYFDIIRRLYEKID